MHDFPYLKKTNRKHNAHLATRRSNRHNNRLNNACMILCWITLALKPIASIVSSIIIRRAGIRSKSILNRITITGQFPAFDFVNNLSTVSKCFSYTALNSMVSGLTGPTN